MKAGLIRQVTGRRRAAAAAAIEAEAREMAVAARPPFLLDPELLSIGCSVPDNGLDRNCYDLLASESRLASLFADSQGRCPGAALVPPWTDRDAQQGAAPP